MDKYLQAAAVEMDEGKRRLREQIKALTDGRGVDVVFDPVGGPMFDLSLRTIAWEGRIVLVGFASGKVPQIPANILLVKNLSAIGVHWGAYRQHAPHILAESFQTLFRWFEEGTIRPHISHRVPMTDFAEALALLKERRSTGKVVLTMGQPTGNPS